MRETSMSDARLDDAQQSLYGIEHVSAWLMAIGAVVLGAIGLLVGFGVIDFRGGNVAGIDLPANLSIGHASTGLFGDNFWDGAMWLTAGFTAAVLALALHASDHHRMRDLSTVRSSERGMWSVEHSLAYLFALGSIALVVIGLLTGYQVFKDSNTQLDGLLWIGSGLGASILTMAMHAVRHHQMAAEEDYMVGVIRERMSATTTTRAMPGASEPGTQRLR